ASQVFGYARQFAKIGIAEALVESLKDGFSSPCLDDICRSVAENGGVDSSLVCIDDVGVQGNNIVAKACWSLLLKSL
nr:hypothetical protein [Tanacetum cinerariifolium]